MNQSDESLVAVYRAGSEPAFEELVARHIGGVYSFVLRLVGETNAAQDIVQEVFVKVWRSINTFDPAQAAFKTWLMRIARNSSIDYLRKRKMIPLSAFDTEDGNVVSDTLADDSLGVEEELSNLEDQQQVMSAVEQLPLPQREVLLLHYQQGLTFDEIGVVLQSSPNTVKSRHRRALHRLRQTVRILPI